MNTFFLPKVKSFVFDMPSPKSIVRRCLSQPVASSSSVSAGAAASLSFPQQPHRSRRDAAVQCTIIRWSSNDNRVLSEFEPREFAAASGFGGAEEDSSSSQELSIAATNGSGAESEWTPPPTSSSVRAIYCYSAPPTRLATRVEQLLLEHYDSDSLIGASGGGRYGTGLSAHSEPEMEAAARCCSAATTMPVSELGDQFKRRKAVTLSDLDIESQTVVTRLSDAAAAESVKGSYYSKWYVKIIYYKCNLTCFC